MTGLNDILCCPKCKKDLQFHAIEGGGDAPFYNCPECGVKYRVSDGVIDFLPVDTVERKRGQKLMESERIVSIYESKWWRANKLFTLFMGISLEGEMAIIKKIADAGPSDTVFDLACGPGLYTRAFAQGSPGGQVIGLDLSWPMLRYGVRKAGRLGINNITFMHGDAHHLPLKDSSVDVANCCGALHLFSDIRQVLSELHRVIKPNGRFTMALARRTTNPFSRLKAYLDGKRWGIHYFYEEELKGLLNEAGFEPVIHHAKGLWMVAGAIRRP